MKPTRRATEVKMIGIEATLHARQRVAGMSIPMHSLRGRILDIVQDDDLSDAQAAEKIKTLGGRQDARTVARVRELLALAQERQWRQQSL